jgi:hypothetical protein
MLAVGIRWQGLLKVEIHIDSGAGAVWRRSNEINSRADQHADKRAQHPKPPCTQQADEVIEGRGVKMNFMDLRESAISTADR